MDSGKLLDLLRRSTEEIIGGEEAVAVAYSGGVDSSIIARIASEFSEVTCYASTTPDSYDARNVKAFAAMENLSLTTVAIDLEGLRGVVARAVAILGSGNPVEIAYTVPVMLVIERSLESLVLVGIGADELFAGYAKYASLEDPTRMMEEDLRKMLQEAEKLETLAASKGKRLGCPFVSEDILSFARSTPLSDKIGSSGHKLILRDVARLLGLESHARPKKAAQYSSGVMRWMERLAKSEGLSLRAWIERIASDEGRSP
ncbi:MAG: asparagine synthase C-terminal domain-containing protein [Thermoplasmata archaeon]